jgi:uncharacterized protein with PIN domain
MLMDKLKSCPICLKATEIVVDRVERDPNGTSMSFGTCAECGREVVVAFRLAPHIREKHAQERAEWIEERRKSGAPIITGFDRQQGPCPHCGEWVEATMEEISTNGDGHRLSWGTCPKCDEKVMSRLTQYGLDWFVGQPAI